MLITKDPRVLIYHKYTLEYVRELMNGTLTSVEEMTVLLHCGILTGDPVNFSEIAKLTQLSSSERAEEVYCQAVRKVRAAIPGSKLETWSIGYQMAYYPQRRNYIYIDPDMPVPKWI